MRRLPASVFLGTASLLLGILSPIPLAAQQGCEFVAPGNDISRTLTVGGLQITYITNPHFLCAGGVEIWADSAEAFPGRGYSHLIGNVRYVESVRELTADDARYFTNEGRLQAAGHVTVVDEEQGSSIENGDLVYLLQTSFRDVAEMTVTTGADGIRPVAVLTPPQPHADSLTADEPRTEEESGSSPAYRVVGDRIFLVGNGYFTASGDVEIEQDSLLAFADSAEYDAEGTGLLLDGNARVLSNGYDLVGRSITMSAPGADASTIHARREARVEGEDLLLTSAQIFLFMQDDQLDRLVATPMMGPAAISADSVDHERPEATVQDFVLTADSLEVRAPNQTVERVFASGSARSVSQAGDSLSVELLPQIAQSDWLEGDTVIVNFAHVGSPPSAAGEAREAARLDVEDIVAIGQARSLYRLAPSDSLAELGVDPPAVHYVVGSQIRIKMVNRQVQGMEVAGQTQGVHLEPMQRRPQADTLLVGDTLALLDTMRISVDTAGIAQATPMAELHDGGRVRVTGPSTPNPTVPRPSRARTEDQPWNRPWIR